jgi:hypothetical protein
MGIKNADLDADFKAVEKVHNSSCKKVINKKVMKQWFYLLILLHAKVFGL